MSLSENLESVEARMRVLDATATRLHTLVSGSFFQTRLVRVLADDVHQQASELVVAHRVLRAELINDEDDGA